MSTYSWYARLKKPSWSPKPAVFGVVWGILYPIIAVSFGYVFSAAAKGAIPWIVTLPFIVNLISNLIFTPIQFGLKNNYLALIDILIVFVTIIWIIVGIWHTFPLIALAQIPYLLWVSIACCLQVSITALNRLPSS